VQLFWVTFNVWFTAYNCYLFISFSLLHCQSWMHSTSMAQIVYWKKLSCCHLSWPICRRPIMDNHSPSFSWRLLWVGHQASFIQYWDVDCCILYCLGYFFTSMQWLVFAFCDLHYCSVHLVHCQYFVCTFHLTAGRVLTRNLMLQYYAACLTDLLLGFSYSSRPNNMTLLDFVFKEQAVKK